MALSQKHSGKMLVPWFNSNEWKYVKDLVFGDSDLEKQQALDIMRIWKIRTPKLPSGVEGTLIILDALLQDKVSTSEHNLQVLCGSAIMRFLNLCGAGGDKQGTFYRIAKQNNIPDWLINLRHDMAHDQIVPSQFMLNLGLSFCFNWVKREYWDKQSLTIKDFIVVPETTRNIEPAVKLYCEMNLVYFLNKNRVSYIRDIAVIDTNLCERICELKDLLDADMKVRKAMALLLESIRSHITGRRQNAELIASILVASGSIFAMELLIKQDGSREIPEDFILIWQDIVNLLYTENMLFPLIKSLLNLSSDEEAPKNTRNYASLWLGDILKCLVLAKAIHEKFSEIPDHENLHKKCAEPCIKNDIIKASPDLQGTFNFDFANCTAIIGELKTLHLEAVKHPHEFTLSYLPYLLLLCNCSAKYIADIEILVKSYTIPEGGIDSDYEMHTAEEVDQVVSEACKIPTETTNVFHPLQLDMQVQTTLEVPERKTKEKKWRIAEDKSLFEGCPLGILSFQSRDVNPLLEPLLGL